jgi:hypothetical protein
MKTIKSILPVVLACALFFAGSVDGRAATTLIYPTVGLTVSDYTITVGASARLHGKVSPNQAGHRVFLQRYRAGAWHNKQWTRLGPYSHYSFTIRPTTTGKRIFRIHDYAIPGWARASSRTVTITVTAGSSCTPGYSPCIPIGSDVDCAGGSGDGPRYVVGPVYVTGSDPYDLDADGDGIGCE